MKCMIVPFVLTLSMSLHLKLFVSDVIPPQPPCIEELGSMQQTPTSAEEKIVFYSTRSGTAQIYSMNTDGSGLQRLTNNSSKDQSPALSPRGDCIVFASNRDGTSRIYIMNTDGSDQRRLTNSTHTEILPSWSPDGKRVVFQIEFKGGNSILCSVSADGTGFRQLTDGSIGYNYPAISPDGSTILCNGPGFQVYVLTIDGEQPRQLGDPSTMKLRPSWSPDAKNIVFGLLRGTPPNHTTELGVMDADGKQERTITEDKDVNEFPCFSPDGKRIAFQSARDGNFEIYTIKRDGSDVRRLTNDPKFDGAPSWGVVRIHREKEGVKK